MACGRIICAQLQAAQRGFFPIQSHFSEKTNWYNLYIYKVYFMVVYLKIIWIIITSVHLNSTGRINDRQKVTRMNGRRDGQIKSTAPHWGPSVISFGNKCIATLDPKLEININPFPVWWSSVAMHLFVLVRL